MITYPNQKVIHIEKPSYKNEDKPFLQVGVSEWQVAASLLTYSAFKLYLYLASNKSDFTLALSYIAVNEAIEMSRNTYDKAVKELIEHGFLTHQVGNIWVFRSYY